MATTTSAPIHPNAPAFLGKDRTLPFELLTAVGKTRSRRRRLSPKEGRAIEILGHAIEYLHDEFILDCISGHLKFDPVSDSRIASIELLKALNREIYLSCPVVPSLRERLSSLFESKMLN